MRKLRIRKDKDLSKIRTGVRNFSATQGITSPLSHTEWGKKEGVFLSFLPVLAPPFIPRENDRVSPLERAIL